MGETVWKWVGEQRWLEYMWETKMREKEILFLFQSCEEKKNGQGSDPAYLQNKTDFGLKTYRFRRPSMFYSGCCRCFSRLYEAEPHEITSTLLSSLLTTFTLISLSKVPLRLQANSHTSRINTVETIRCQRWSERDWLLSAIVYVRKYTGCFLC